MASAPEIDDVYLTQMVDNLSLTKSMVIAWTLRFNDVLDADMLHDALSRLLQIGDWRKFGGRLRIGTNKHKALEVHTPRVFSEKRPPVSFSHERQDVSISEHPVAQKLPVATERPSLQSGSGPLTSLAIPPNAPTTVRDYTSKDIPVLGLRVVSFNDATLVSISWPHVLFDGKGFCHLLEAWSLVLAGRDDEVPKVLDVNDDVLYNIGSRASPGPDSAAANSRILTGFSLIFFLIRFLWGIFTQPAAVNRLVCLPRHTVKKMHEQALYEIKDEAVGDKKPWVSESDVIMAWVARMLTRAESNPRPLTIITPVDARPRLSQLRILDGVYIQNLLLATFVTAPVTLLRGQTGKLALLARQGLMEQLQESSLIGVCQAVHSRWDENSSWPVVFGSPGSTILTANNRPKIDIMGSANFRPAVLSTTKRESRSEDRTGRPIFHQSLILSPSRAVRNFVTLHMKDLEGHIWVVANLTPRQWAVIEKELGQLP